MEEALYDSVAMRSFVGIDLGKEPVPDETTVMRFRHLLEKNKLGEQIFAEVDQPGSNWALGFGHPSWRGTEQDRKVTGMTAVNGYGSPDSTLLTPSGASSWPSRMAEAAWP